MPVVQEHDAEDLMLEIPQERLQVGFRVFGAADGVAFSEAILYALPGGLDEFIGTNGAVDAMGISDSNGSFACGRGHHKVLCPGIDGRHDHTAPSAGFKYFGQTGTGRRAAPTRV